MNRVLVLNAGSSTLKWSVLPSPAAFAPSPSEPLAEGALEWESADPGRQAEQVQGVLRHGLTGVDAVGHRVVHGGARFRAPVRVTAEVRQALGDLAEVDPLH